MSGPLFALMEVVLTLGGVAVGWYAPRLFPKYRRGTPVLVDWSHTIRASYLYRSSVGFHKVQILPGGILSNRDGRIITVRTSELRRASEPTRATS